MQLTLTYMTSLPLPPCNTDAKRTNRYAGSLTKSHQTPSKPHIKATSLKLIAPYANAYANVN